MSDKRGRKFGIVCVDMMKSFGLEAGVQTLGGPR